MSCPSAPLHQYLLLTWWLGARAIHAIGVRCFGLIWSNYYDDFPQLDLKSCGDSSMETAEKRCCLVGGFPPRPRSGCPCQSVSVHWVLTLTCLSLRTRVWWFAIDQQDELRWALDFVSSCPPRVLKTHVEGDRVLISTDACLESDDSFAGIGMVAYVWRNYELVKRVFFAEQVPAATLQAMQTDTPKVIAALELLASVAAVDCLTEYLRAARTFIFVDNEAARANLISMFSPVLIQARLLQHLYRHAAANSMFLWISRVPSASNIADKPSRGDISELVQQGFTRLTPVWPM